MPHHLDTASVNNVDENGAWQFQTSTDKANQAAVQDAVQRKKAVVATATGVSYDTGISGATAVGNSAVSTVAAR